MQAVLRRLSVEVPTFSHDRLRLNSGSNHVGFQTGKLSSMAAMTSGSSGWVLGRKR